LRLASSTYCRRLVMCAVIGSLAVAGVDSIQAAGSRSHADSAARATIGSVSFSGSHSMPVITVVGKGLSIPRPLPAVSPSNQPLCPLKIKGNAGKDYGTRFYLLAFSTASGADQLEYAAGRYRPSLNELDCIGIVVLSHSPTRVRFTLGAAARQFRDKYPPIVNGDLVEVVLQNAAYGLVVRYH